MYIFPNSDEFSKYLIQYNTMPSHPRGLLFALYGGFNHSSLIKVKETVIVLIKCVQWNDVWILYKQVEKCKAWQLMEKFAWIRVVPKHEFVYETLKLFI